MHAAGQSHNNSSSSSSNQRFNQNSLGLGCHFIDTEIWGDAGQME